MRSILKGVFMRIFIIIAVLLYSAGFKALYAEDNPLLGEITQRGQKDPVDMESIDAREMKERPDRDMGTSLNEVYGVNIKRRGAIADDIVFRGFQKDNINVLIDGVRVNGACPDRMDAPITHYDFDQIDHINFVKGPYDLTSFGGMAGTLNAVSKKPVRPFGGGLDLTYGSYNSLNVSADASCNGYKFDSVLGYDYKVSDVPTAGDGKRITDIYAPSNPSGYRQDAINSLYED